MSEDFEKDLCRAPFSPFSALAGEAAATNVLSDVLAPSLPGLCTGAAPDGAAFSPRSAAPATSPLPRLLARRRRTLSSVAPAGSLTFAERAGAPPPLCRAQLAAEATFRIPGVLKACERSAGRARLSRDRPSCISRFPRILRLDTTSGKYISIRHRSAVRFIQARGALTARPDPGRKPSEAAEITFAPLSDPLHALRVFASSVGVRAHLFSVPGIVARPPLRRCATSTKNSSYLIPCTFIYLTQTPGAQQQNTRGRGVSLRALTFSFSRVF